MRRNDCSPIEELRVGTIRQERGALVVHAAPLIHVDRVDKSLFRRHQDRRLVNASCKLRRDDIAKEVGPNGYVPPGHGSIGCHVDAHVHSTLSSAARAGSDVYCLSTAKRGIRSGGCGHQGRCGRYGVYGRLRRW